MKRILPIDDETGLVTNWETNGRPAATLLPREESFEEKGKQEERHYYICVYVSGTTWSLCISAMGRKGDTYQNRSILN